MQSGYATLIKQTLIVAAIAILPFLIWYLFDVIFVIFGAIILATLLRLGAEPFTRWLALPERVALALSGLLVLAVVGATAFLFGTRIFGELQDVLQRAGSAVASLQVSLQGSDFGKFVTSHLIGSSFSLADMLTGFVKVSFSLIEGL